MNFWAIGLWVLGTLAIGFLIYRLVGATQFLLKYRGKRLVRCPETRMPAAVEVSSGRGAALALAGLPELRLRDCSRWPERENCGQDCLNQIEADPETCLVWNIVNGWYLGKTCVTCGRSFGRINWHDHRPALLDEDLRTVQWTEIAPERLPEVFATYSPVCWNCHIAESFRRAHPELVTDR